MNLETAHDRDTCGDGERAPASAAPPRFGVAEDADAGRLRRRPGDTGTREAPLERLSLVAWGEREIALTGMFQARRAMVFAALTTPSAISRWMFDAPDWTMPVCEVDLRVGGAYRCRWRHTRSGAEALVSGIFHAIVAGEFLSHSHRYETPRGATEALVTTVLTAEARGTRLRTVMLYESRAGRDRALSSLMARDAAACCLRLEALCAETMPTARVGNPARRAAVVAAAGREDARAQR